MSIKVESSTHPEPDKAESVEEKESAKGAEESDASEKDESKDESEESPELDEGEGDESEDDESSEDDSDDDESEDEKEEDSEKQKPKRKSGAERRIKSLLKKRSEAERKAEYWKNRALESQELATKTKSDEKVDETEGANDDPEPNPDDFETHAEYIKELGKWSYRNEKRADEAKQKQSEAKTAYQTRFEKFTKRAQEFAQEKDDVMDVMQGVDGIPLSMALEEALFESDLGPEVLYELAKDPDAFERVNKLSVIGAAREVGRIEARLSKTGEESPKKQERKTTKAPPPPKPVGKKSSQAVKKSIYDDDISQEEFEQLRAQQIKERAKRA